ncbi:ABC transporter substrate-binding protein [Homoserinibacter sp. GY 40078]|uniref:ABC transporter substrate-binding protein n=1 Tax=Homoserinibacter sp. GY 40078 TaxID=2603275 RepID=UPI0011C72A1A|nr:sugar ABC transporter substrate-binding protein [Homoserinibacter sp. GY 40078]TXK18559.1 sugar ABC transporter substrate-binding protein [Homoserinibacter sp. GY 40078]
MTYPHTARSRARRIGAVVAGAAVFAGALTACSPESSDDGPVTITVWTWDQPGQGLEAAIPAFEDAHPDITVKVENVGNPAIWDKITTGMAAGGSGLADIMNIGVDYMGNYIETFPDGFANLSEMGADDLESDFPATLWGSAQDTSGNVYGIPYEVNTNVVFYREDLFEEAGIDMDSIATWDQLLDAGVTLKEKTGSYLFAMDKAASESDSANLWQILARLQGTFFFNKDGDIALSDTGSVAALDFLKRANDAGIVADIPGGWDNLMTQVKGEANVALLASASWMAGVFPDNAPDLAGKWAVRRPPAMVEGGYTAASAGGTFLSIAESSAHKDAAWEFVKFSMATLEGQELVYEGAGLFPSYSPMWSTDAFTAPNDYFDGELVNQLFVEALSEDTPPDYYTSDYAKALKAYTDAQTQVLLSGADPQEALDAAADLLAQQTGRDIAS